MSAPPDDVPPAVVSALEDAARAAGHDLSDAAWQPIPGGIQARFSGGFVLTAPLYNVAG